MFVSGIVLGGGMGSGKDTVGGYVCQSYGYERISIAEPMYRVADFARHVVTDRHAGYSRARLLQLLEDLLGSSRSLAGEELPAVDLLGVADRTLKLAVDSDLLDATVSKPRHFLQGFGDLARSERLDVFTDYLLRTAVSRSVDRWLDEGEFRFIVTDARVPHEMDALRSGSAYARRVLGEAADYRISLVRIHVSEETAVERIMSRDGTSREEVLRALKHPTEQALRNVPDSYFDHVIDSEQSFEGVYNAADAMMREIGQGSRP